MTADTLFASAVTLIFIFDKSGGAQKGLCAAAFHEFGHLLCMAALSDIPSGITFTPFGLKITRSKPPPSYFAEAAEAAAGPAANLLLAAALSVLNRFFGGLTEPVYINVLMAAFNLLPIEPLDGGSILRCLLRAHGWMLYADRAVGIVTAVGSAALAAAGAALLIKSGYNFTMLAVSFYLIVCLLSSDKRA